MVLCSLSVFAVPSVIFSSQSPSDVDSSNIFGTSLNIYYTITDPAGIDPNSPRLYHELNASYGTCLGFANGTNYSCGYQVIKATSNVSSSWLFQLMDNQVYPGTYNWPNERQLELYTKSFATLTKPDTQLLIEMLNVSSNKKYGMFEVYANRTSGNPGLNIYYCNSSYDKQSNPANHAACTGFATIPPAATYNHTHGPNSFHFVVPFSMNTTAGTIGGVKITPISYFIYRPTTGSGVWRVYYITNVTRTNATMSRTFPAAFTTLSGTVDSHLHQYDGTEQVCYYACANNTGGVSNCSTVRCDSIDLNPLPPVPPFVYNPQNGTYSGNITINYTAATSPNNYSIMFYNITLVDSSYNFVTIIRSNNSLNLGYVWNSASVADGYYFIRVEACDSIGQCSFGYSGELYFNNGNTSMVPEFSFSTLIFASVLCLFSIILLRRK